MQQESDGQEGEDGVLPQKDLGALLMCVRVRLAHLLLMDERDDLEGKHKEED